MTETELVTAAKSGDVDAFCELYEIHKRKLLIMLTINSAMFTMPRMLCRIV